MAGDERVPRRTLADRVADDLRQRVVAGEWPAGSRLPGEHQLASTYDVSRATIRSALQALMTQGLTHTRHGSGTYVTGGTGGIHADLRSLDSMTATIEASGARPGVVYRRRAVDAADAGQAERLEVPVGTPVLTTERALTADDRPVAFSYDVIPWELFGDGFDLDRVEGSLYALLEGAGVEIGWAVASLHAASGRDIGWGRRPKDALYLLLSPGPPHPRRPPRGVVAHLLPRGPLRVLAGPHQVGGASGRRLPRTATGDSLEVVRQLSRCSRAGRSGPVGPVPDRGGGMERTIDWVDGEIHLIDQTRAARARWSCCGSTTVDDAGRRDLAPGRARRARARRGRRDGRRPARRRHATRTTDAAAVDGAGPPRAARPTAVNLACGVDRALRRTAAGGPDDACWPRRDRTARRRHRRVRGRCAAAAPTCVGELVGTARSGR